MTRDDIIPMAREARGGATWWPIHVDILERFAALVAAAEREACAVVAWSTGMDLHLKQHDAREIGAACAAAIRARGADD